MCENECRLHGQPVTFATAIPEYALGGRHGRVLVGAFERLSLQPLELSETKSTIVTVVVDGPGTWPINAIVMPNDDRKVYWAVHARHSHIDLPDQIKLSPFVYRDHGKQAPMTKALTLELTGTPKRPILMNVYAGTEIPPLPWEINHNDNPITFQKSVSFWQKRSFIYDVGSLANKKDDAKKKVDLQSTAPAWHTIEISNSLQPC